jgi:hypothetical protein
MQSRDDMVKPLAQGAQLQARRALRRSEQPTCAIPPEPVCCPLLEDIHRLELVCDEVRREAVELEQVAGHLETLRQTLVAMRALLRSASRRKRWSHRRARRVRRQLRHFFREMDLAPEGQVWPRIPLATQRQARETLWQIEDAIQSLALHRALIRRAVRLLRQRSQNLDSSVNNYRSVTADVSDVNQALGALFPEAPQGRSRSTAVLSLLS